MGSLFFRDRQNIYGMPDGLTPFQKKHGLMQQVSIRRSPPVPSISLELPQADFAS